MRSPRRILRSLLVAGLLGALALLGAGCASAPVPVGEPFMEAPPPGPKMARLYIYRMDAVAGGGARVSLDLGDRDLGNLRNREYLTLLVPPGRHVLYARYLSLLSGTHSDIPISTSAGFTYFVHLYADSQERQQQAGLGREVYSVGLFAAIRSAADALPQLQRCTQQPAEAVPDES